MELSNLQEIKIKVMECGKLFLQQSAQ